MAEPVEIVPYRARFREGFAGVVATVLAELGFAVDPVLDADLAQPEAHYGGIWLALADGQVVGSVAVRRSAPGAAELKRMYLLPAFRGMGLGRRLLGLAVAWAREQDCSRLHLDTGSDMAAAQGFYESYGFVRTGSRTEVGGNEQRCEVLYELAI